MTVMMTTPEQMLCLALLLTALLTMAGGDPIACWERAHAAPPAPSCLPFIVLVGLAIACGVFGLAHPEEFAAASGMGVLDPGSPFIVALGP